MKLNEAISLIESYTDVDGLGSMAINQDIHYFGIRVLMSPAVFLSLAAEVGAGAKEDSIGHIIDHIREGGKVAPPYLMLELPSEWTGKMDNGLSMPQIVGHEGRHRMLAISLLADRNTPVEVHITFNKLRRRNIKEEWIEELNDGIMNETGDRVIYRAIRRVL